MNLFASVPKCLSSRERILPRNDEPGIYGSRVTGCLIIGLSMSPMSNPAAAPPMCKPVNASIWPVISTFPCSLIYGMQESSPVLGSPACCSVIRENGFEEIYKTSELACIFVYFVNGPGEHILQLARTLSIRADSRVGESGFEQHKFVGIEASHLHLFNHAIDIANLADCESPLLQAWSKCFSHLYEQFATLLDDPLHLLLRRSVSTAVSPFFHVAIPPSSVELSSAPAPGGLQSVHPADAGSPVAAD